MKTTIFSILAVSGIIALCATFAPAPRPEAQIKFDQVITTSSNVFPYVAAAGRTTFVEQVN